MTERISIDGEPISEEIFDEVWAQIRPMAQMVDDMDIDGVKMTFFEAITGLAYAAFADAPVDVMVMEVGMGGRWDATSVADAKVAVIAPISYDHMNYLGSTLEEIAIEKSGIIKPGGTAVIAQQQPEAFRVIAEHCTEVGAPLLMQGRDFGVLDRTLAADGQVLRIMTGEGPLGDLYLPLHGAHMADNAALAVGAVEALLGRPLNPEVIGEGFSAVKAPARLEVAHTEPTVILDGAHNPAAVAASLAGIQEAFDFSPLIGVVAMMADKDVETALKELEEALDTIVVTTLPGNQRAMSVDELTELAGDIFGESRVRSEPDPATALDAAMGIAERAGNRSGVLVIGSVYLAGEVKPLLGQITDAE
jgi:dihydrofolate synthase/folylpolyglutamate synthase